MRNTRNVTAFLVGTMVLAAPMWTRASFDERKPSHRGITPPTAAVLASDSTCEVGLSLPFVSIPKPLPKTVQRNREIPEFVRKASEIHRAEFEKLRGGKGFAHSQSKAELRGWKPTGVVIGHRVKVPSQRRASSIVRASFRPGQTYNDSDSDAAIWAHSYDDGNDETWEGIISILVHEYSEWADFEVQFHTASADNVYVSELTYYDGGTRFPGDGPYEYLEASIGAAGDRRARIIRAASAMVTRAADGGVQRTRSRCLAACARGKMVNAGYFTLGFCGTAAFGCGGTGPAYFFCLGASCSGAALVGYGGVLLTLDECEQNCG